MSDTVLIAESSANNDETLTSEASGSTDRKAFEKELTSSDCVLIVMGTLGAGRTSFIHQLMDTEMPESIRSPALQLQPDTTDIDYRCIEPAPFTKGNRLFVLDTPAITDKATTNSDLLRDLGHWIGAAVRKKVSFIGFIFLHDLNNLDVDFLFEHHLPQLWLPCTKKKIPHQLVFASTKWSKVKSERSSRKGSRNKKDGDHEAEEAHEYLESKRWAKLIEDGAQVVKMKDVGTLEKQIVQDMLPEPKPKEAGRFWSSLRFSSFQIDAGWLKRLRKHIPYTTIH